MAISNNDECHQEPGILKEALKQANDAATLSLTQTEKRVLQLEADKINNTKWLALRLENLNE